MRENPDIQHKLKQDLKFFALEAFRTLNPSTDFQDNWHIDMILEYLKAVSEKKVKRLLINMPPRYLKSHLVNVIWPSWVLLNDPTKRIISASYTDKLSIKHSLDSRAILNSDLIKQHFPDFALRTDQNTKNKFMTNQQGFRFSTSVGGTLTGEGGDVLILDDPQNPAQIHSANYREKIANWFKEVFITRLNNKRDGSIITIMQRLHHEDLSAELIASKNWELLKLEAIAKCDLIHQVGSFYYERKEGEVLHAMREDKDLLEALRLELGNNIFNAQYQQEPLEGNSFVFDTNWLNYYQDLPDEDGQIFQSWDTAIKTNENSDYSACTTWKVIANNFYLIDIYRAKLPYHELKAKVIELYEEYLPSHVIIEDTASGQSLIQELKFITKMPIISQQTRGDKLSRFLKVQGFFESGKVCFPHYHKEKNALITELISFPHGKHDDMVDTISQFIIWHMNRKKASWNTGVFR